MAADVGNQIVTIRFGRPVDSDIVNKRFKDIRPLGIYKGGYLTITGGGNVSLSPLVCEIRDGGSATDHQVRVETTIAVTKVLTEEFPYLILTWAYSGVENIDYMIITTSSLPDTNDLIVAKGHFVVGNLTSIDYSERTIPSVHDLFLHVEEMETPNNYVRIRGGVGHRASIHTPIIDQSLLISGCTGGETVYVYVTDSGGVAQSKVPATYAGKALLAKIIYPANHIIENSDIEDVRSFITPPAIPDDLTIERNSYGKLGVKDNSIGDDKLGVVISLFGTKVTKDSQGNNFARDVVYKANSDGYLGVIGSATSSGDYTIYFKILVGNTNPPTSSRYTFSHRLSGSGRRIGPSGVVPIIKGEYFKVIYYYGGYKYSLSDYWWIPVGNGTCVKQ